MRNDGAKNGGSGFDRDRLRRLAENAGLRPPCRSCLRYPQHMEVQTPIRISVGRRRIPTNLIPRDGGIVPSYGVGGFLGPGEHTVALPLGGVQLVADATPLLIFCGPRTKLEVELPSYIDEIRSRGNSTRTCPSRTDRLRSLTRRSQNRTHRPRTPPSVSRPVSFDVRSLGLYSPHPSPKRPKFP